MQTDENVEEWIERAFGKLPGCDDELFQRLWDRGFLKYAGDKDTDDVDFYNARLVCASITKRGRLFILLPDYEARRPALLFATALLRYWFDHRDLSIGQSRPVVYFGSAVGIRDQLRLSNVRDSNLDLATIFQQQDVLRGRTSAQLAASDAATEGLLKSRLPEAVTVYAPADPVSVLKSIKPSWVALDVGDSDSLPWLEPLLSYATRTAIPIIGWGQNPLGESIEVFTKHCSVFQWPIKAVADSRDATVPNADNALGALLRSRSRSEIQPLVLEATGLSTFSDALERASRGLLSTGGAASGPLLTDTIALHWRYLRAIESLCVPCDLYDAEAPKMWGLHSFPQLASTCERFRRACKGFYTASIGALEEVAVLLDTAVERLRSTEPPLWTALCNLCLEEQPRDIARVIVFPSHATKHLFQLSLLSRCNVSPDDLLELRVWLLSLYELRLRSPSRMASANERDPLSSDMPDAALSWHPLVVGVPGPRRAADMSRLLRENTLEFLIFQHQLPTLVRRVRQWAERLTPNIARDLNVLGGLSGLRGVPKAPGQAAPLSTRPPVGVSVDSAKRQAAPQLERFLTLNEPVAEVSGLFDVESSDDSDEGPSIDRDRNPEPSAIEAYCDGAIAVQFSHGWQGLFAPDDSLNLIVSTGNGVATDERFVRALRSGDRVVLIHGARRQSLYELVIDRVHRHPAIELHLALIRRWREDFRMNFERWQSQGSGPAISTSRPRTLDVLLTELRSRGSELISPGTLYQWLQGWTLSPQDPLDLLRAADVLGMGFVKKYHKAIANAASRIRGLHRGLSNRLNRWLAEQAPGLAAKASDDMIDEELGLTFDDFRNSLIVADVVHVESRKGLFLRSRLGQISQEGN